MLGPIFGCKNDSTFTVISKTTLIFHWCTSEVKTGPPCPNTDTIRWKNILQAFLLPSVWGADDTQASQVHWDCMVLPVLRKAPFTTCCISHFMFRSINTKISYTGSEYTSGYKLKIYNLEMLSVQLWTFSARNELTEGQEFLLEQPAARQ